MKILPIVGIAIAIGAIAYFAGLGVAANTVQVVLQSVNINGITNIQITLMIQNVSNATLQINSMTGTVTLNGSTLGNISSFTPVTVPPNSQVPITVTLNASLITLPAVIQNLLQGANNNQLNFVVAGNINLNSMVVPFSVSDTVTY